MEPTRPLLIAGRTLLARLWSILHRASMNRILIDWDDATSGDHVIPARK